MSKPIFILMAVSHTHADQMRRALGIAPTESIVATAEDRREGVHKCNVLRSLRLEQNNWLFIYENYGKFAYHSGLYGPVYNTSDTRLRELCDTHRKANTPIHIQPDATQAPNTVTLPEAAHGHSIRIPGEDVHEVSALIQAVENLDPHEAYTIKLHKFELGWAAEVFIGHGHLRQKLYHACWAENHVSKMQVMWMYQCLACEEEIFCEHPVSVDKETCPNCVERQTEEALEQESIEIGNFKTRSGVD